MPVLDQETRKGKVGSIEWRVSVDSLALLCRGVPDPEPSPTGDEIIEALRGAGITAQVDREILETVLQGLQSDWVVVARGVPPGPPAHGYLEYYVDPLKLDGRAWVTENGGVDHKRLNLILNVSKGQQLVRKHDPIPGEPGTDVFGNPVPPEDGHEVSIPVGSGIELLEDGRLAVATEDGALVSGRDGFTLSKLYSIAGDVCYKTGNIDFCGSVDVGGNVLSGFELRAEGDILVRAAVEAARIEATGNVTILGGIQGGGKAFIRAGGNVSAKFASEAAIEASGDVLIHTQLVNCRVCAQGEVVVEGTPGAMVGGEVRSGQNVRAKSVGSSSGVKTLVQIGLDSDLLRKITALDEDFKDLEVKAGDIHRILGGLEHVRGETGALPPDKEAIRVKVIREKFNLKGRMSALAANLAAMRKDLDQARKGTIRADDTIFGGVTLRIGSDTLNIGHAMRHATFYYERGEIRSSAE